MYLGNLVNPSGMMPGLSQSTEPSVTGQPELLAIRFLRVHAAQTRSLRGPGRGHLCLAASLPRPLAALKSRPPLVAGGNGEPIHIDLNALLSRSLPPLRSGSAQLARHHSRRWSQDGGVRARALVSFTTLLAFLLPLCLWSSSSPVWCPEVQVELSRRLVDVGLVTIGSAV